MSPTSRTLHRLKREGYQFGVVERWNPGARVRQDFLGFADVLAVRADEIGVTALQVCRVRDQATRLTKICTTPEVAVRARVWLAAGNRLLVEGWAKRGARGKRKTWANTLTGVAPEMLTRVLPTPKTKPPRTRVSAGAGVGVERPPSADDGLGNSQRVQVPPPALV